jgi:hypothetical protein
MLIKTKENVGTYVLAKSWIDWRAGAGSKPIEVAKATPEGVHGASGTVVGTSIRGDEVAAEEYKM